MPRMIEYLLLFVAVLRVAVLDRGDPATENVLPRRLPPAAPSPERLALDTAAPGRQSVARRMIAADSAQPPSDPVSAGRDALARDAWREAREAFEAALGPPGARLAYADREAFAVEVQDDPATGRRPVAEAAEPGRGLGVVDTGWATQPWIRSHQGRER
jgi:hypothetical protein